MFLSFMIFNLIIFFSGPAGAVQPQKPVVVSSSTQIADFVRQVVGNQAVVKSILAPRADPHTYNVTSADVQIVLGADLCIENGLHLDKKLGSPKTDPHGKTIPTTQNNSGIVKK